MDFRAILTQHKLVVGDGAMGSQLMARGLPGGVPGDLWNLERPEVVEAIQRDYVQAGAQFLLTNTLGANAVALGRYGLAERLEEVNAAAVQIARRASEGRAAVLADLGPTGELLEPLGTLSRAKAAEAFAAQVQALVRAGVDGFIGQTFESSEELWIALDAARQACALPLIASMKFQPVKGGGYRTMMGEGPDRLAALARELGCTAVGTNCGQGIGTMVGAVAEIAKLTDLPVLAEPNAGLPALVEGRTVYREDAAVFARHLPELYRAGARIIGGCCGTAAEHIRAIRRFADSL